MLDRREAHYLGEIGRGRTIEDIARDHGTDVAAIAETLDAACEKLGAANLLQAVLKAIRLAEISDNDNRPGEEGDTAGT